MKKKLLIVILLVALTCMLVSCSIEKIGETYVSVDGGMELKRFVGKTNQLELTVPDTYEDQPIISLGQFAIATAEYLEVVNLGKNIQSIDSWAFTSSAKLKAINVDPTNAYFTSVDGVLYNKEKTVLLVFPNMNTQNFAVPATVTEIGNNAFYKCSNLFNVTFPEGLTKIGDRAFQSTTDLTPPVFPSTLTTIGYDAFSYTRSSSEEEFKARKVPTEIYIPESVTSIGEWAFFGSGLTKVKMQRGSAEGISIAENWLPIKSGEVSKKISVEWGVAK